MKRRIYIFAMLVLMATLVGCRKQPPTVFSVGELPPTGFADPTGWQNEANQVVANRQAEAPPVSLYEFENQQRVPLTLQDALRIAFENSEVIRATIHTDSGNGGDSFRADIASVLGTNSVYDPEIMETDPNQGLHRALSEFDSQLSTSIFWDKLNRPQNFGFFLPVLAQDQAHFDLTVGKKTRYGTQLFFRNVTDYNRNNNAFQSLSSIYTTNLEIEARQPLLQGFGRAVNEYPIELARLNNDMTLLQFEEGARNLVRDVENAYWDLKCAYEIVKSFKLSRDRARATWERLKTIQESTTDGPTNTLQSHDLYLGFEVQLTSALRDLARRETALRFLIKLPASDGRLVEPIDQPVAVPIQFNWSEIQAEALVRRPELRRQRFAIQQRELGILVAKNQMLPTLNVVGLYRWLGVGDELWASQGSGLRFPSQGSRAFEELAMGEYQEARFGVELVMPKYRNQIASVRNSQLAVMRERAKLETMEDAASHALMNAVRDAEVNFQMAGQNREREKVTSAEVSGRNDMIERKGIIKNPLVLTQLFDAQRRNADATTQYHRAICNYNKAIAFVHFRKGSLFEYNNIRLAEVPWHASQYFSGTPASTEMIDYRATDNQ